MKQSFLLSMIGAALVLMLSGCTGPRLVSRPLTPEEFAWSLVIHGSYPAWKPPYFSPLSGEAGSAAVNIGNQLDAVPSPASAPQDDPATLSEEVEFVPAIPVP